MRMRGRARLLAVIVLLAGGPSAEAARDGGTPPEWQPAARLPVARSEVAAAVVGEEIAIIGGFLPDGKSSPRVDAYSPRLDRWRRLPDLPVAVNHAMAAGHEGRLYVVGGYGQDRTRLRTAFVLGNGRWRALPRLPAARAAAGAAVVRDMLVVAGGVGPRGLARESFALDLRSEQWSRLPGPTPREHLGVAALGGRVYAVGGRTAGFDTNLDLAEVFVPGLRTWRSLPPLPEPRGGTGLAALRGQLVSVGGEAPEGTISSVYAYDLGARRWRRMPDLPTARHGLGVEAVGGRVYAIGGGLQPGLSVSATNETLVVR
jgi:N-acetylneuraminic acid mutarotase